MTEAEKVFNQTSLDRKRTARGAYAKKNGSKSKKCSFPSDYLSAKEKEALNGECISIKMNEPFTNFKAFKMLSVDTQHEYLSHLITDKKARMKDIAGMFNISPVCLSQWIGASALKDTLPKPDPKERFQASETWIAFAQGRELPKISAPNNNSPAPASASPAASSSVPTDDTADKQDLAESTQNGSECDLSVSSITYTCGAENILKRIESVLSVLPLDNTAKYGVTFTIRKEY